MKIIKTPLKWESSTSGSSSGWLISYDDVESAEITVDELTGVSRTGTVDFRQSESEKPGTVAVTQNRVNTYYYVLKTNVETEPVFEFSWEGSVTTVTTDITATTNGFAVKISNPNEAAPKEVTAAPVTKIAELKVSSSEVTFEYAGGSSKEEFKWINWDKSGSTLTRQTTSGHTTGSINSASTTITSVDLVSVSPGVDWITATEKGNIFATSNTGEARSAIITYTYCSKTATVNVTQEGKPEPIIQYFGVKTQSRLANDKAATFTISGESGETSKDVNFSGITYNSTKYYIAYITATSDSSVSASCDISQYAIDVSPNTLEFPSTGGTRYVTVTAERTRLNVSNQKLKGYTGDIELDNLYEITAETSHCDYGASVDCNKFKIEGAVGETTTISAGTNESTSGRTGTATFTIDESGEASAEAKVQLTQPNVHWFSFESTIVGSPEETTGTVSFYKSIGSTTGTPFATKDYRESGGAKHVEWSGFVEDAGAITYKVDGFDDSAVISASTDRVDFNNITMQPVDGKYHISGAETSVTVSASGVSYKYKCSAENTSHTSYISYPYTTIGVIPYNYKLTLSATATTTNEFYTSAEYSGTDRNNWEYVVNSGDHWTEVTTVNVKCLALRQPSTKKVLELTYHLGNGDDGFNIYTAKTTFEVPASADSGINFDNFALSSQTKFWNAYHENNNEVPTGNNAYKFAFIPSSRKSFSDVSGKTSAYTNHADLGYRTTKNQGGWMLLHPYSPEETSGYCTISEFDSCNHPQKYIAKIYAISYANDQHSSGKDDVWTLGPLLYDNVEVDGFKFLSSSTMVYVAQTKSQYPDKCPIQGLSASSAYFGVYIDRDTVSSATSGTISGGGKQWYVRGHAQGTLSHTSAAGHNSFFANIDKMRDRNVNFQYSEEDHCPDLTDSSTRYSSPFAMAYAVTGNLNTNLLGAVNLRMIYYGKYGQGTDVPSTGTHYVPASEYVVLPTTPGDTSSVVYDAEADEYIIYDITKVRVISVSDHMVVPEAELGQFIPQTSGEIIDPVGP